MVVNVFFRRFVFVLSKLLNKKRYVVFRIFVRGFSGRYCEVSLNEQCGTFSSTTTIEIDCVLCICYNGLFMCDIQPIGLCRKLFFICYIFSLLFYVLIRS
jgi:hypothetical protein